MAGKTTKRSQPVSMEEKIAAIARVQAGESKASVARDLVIPESTLRGWCKNEKKISFLSTKRLSSPDSDDSGSNSAKVAKRVRKSSPIGSRDRWSDLITQAEQFSYNSSTFTQSGAGLDYSTVMKHWTSAIFQQLQGMPTSTTTPSWPISGITSVPTTSVQPSTTVSTPTTSLSAEDQLPWLSHQALLQNILTPSTTPTTQAGTSVNSMALAYAVNAYKLNLLSTVGGPSSLPTARISPNPAISRSTSTSPLSSIYGCKSEPINLSEPRYSGSENDADDAPLNMTVNNGTFREKSTPSISPVPSPLPTPSEDKGDKKDNAENKISIAATAEQRQEVEKPRNMKNRTVLDSLYHNNNNNINENDRDKPKQTREEGVNHGDMFLEFLKDCGEPFVTQVQVSLVASLMRNFHNSDTRKFKRSKRK